MACKTQREIKSEGETAAGLKIRFEKALTNLDQVEAMNCLNSGVQPQDSFKSYLVKPSANVFIQHITEKCCSSPKLENWAIWLAVNFSPSLQASSLLRLSINANQRTLVNKLLQLNLTYDINQNNLVTKDDQEIAELAARKDFPAVINFCHKNTSLKPINKVISAACKFASLESFKALLALNVNIDSMDSIQQCISNISAGDFSKRMQMIEMMVLKYANKLEPDQILCSILRRYNFEWFNQIFNTLKSKSLATLKSNQPLRVFLETLACWDIDDIEPILKILGTPEHLKNRTEVLSAIFSNFNDLDDEVLVLEVLRVLKDATPAIEFVGLEDSLLQYLYNGLITDESIGNFFKCADVIGRVEWKSSDASNQHKLLSRFKKVANSAKQDIVKKTFSGMPAKLISVLLNDLLTTEHNLSAESIKLAEAICNHGKIFGLDAQDSKQLLLLAQRKNLSSIVEFIKQNKQ